MNTNVPGLLCLLALLLAETQDAWSTSPIAYPPSKVWKETSEGEVIYAQADEARLLSLCVEVDGVANWLPSSLLLDISYPRLDKIELRHGMGLEDLHDYVPHSGNWGLSIEVESEIEIDGRFEDGPTYYFVLDEHKNPVYRMSRVWVPSESHPRSKESQVQWLKIPSSEVRRAPCWPTP